MKCKNCHGTGQEKIYDPLTNAYLLIKCAYCNGSGELPQTNEEHIRSCSFNELARVLYCMIINGDRIRPDLAYIKKWLKEKHE